MNVKVQKEVNGDMYVIPSNAMKYLHAMVDILLYVSENVKKVANPIFTRNII